MFLYKHLPRSENSKTIVAANSVAHQRLAANPNFNGSTLFDRGWQQPLDHTGAQPARRVKDAEGTAQPLVLESVCWLGYLLLNMAAFPMSKPLLHNSSIFALHCYRPHLEISAYSN